MGLKPNLMIWTDGSRQKGTGFAGCAFVVTGGPWKESGGFAVALGKQPQADVTERYGHLWALRFALWAHENCVPGGEKRAFDNVVIATDSKFTSEQYDNLRYGENSDSATASDTARAVVVLINKLASFGIGVEINWERRDSSLGNREADRLARAASEQSVRGAQLEEWMQEMEVEQV